MVFWEGSDKLEDVSGALTVAEDMTRDGIVSVASAAMDVLGGSGGTTMGLSPYKELMALIIDSRYSRSVMLLLRIVSTYV